MRGNKTPDVMVVGAGPVGLFSALSLARKGVKVRIIDEGWRPATHSYALALHPSSLRLLHRSGIDAKVLKRIHRINRVGLYDDHERQATIDFSKLDTDFNYIGILPQNVLEEALEAALQTHGVNVDWNHRLSKITQTGEGRVDIVLDRLTMESLGYAVAHTDWVVASSHDFKVPFVIGADGHGSMVRRALGIDFEDAGRTRYFAVFEFKTDADVQDEMRIVLAEDSTSVLWPLPNGHCRWSFELRDFAAPPASRDKDRFLIQRIDLPELADENFESLIRKRAPWFTGSIEKLEWKTVVRFEQRLATLFGTGRSWLVGDAAHMALPVAVQSMNVGLLEALELAEAIRGSMEGEVLPEKLSSFGTKSLTRWRALLGLEGEKLSYATGALPWVRAHGERIASSVPASGKHRQELLKQVGVDLTSSRKVAQLQ